MFGVLSVTFTCAKQRAPVKSCYASSQDLIKNISGTCFKIQLIRKKMPVGAFLLMWKLSEDFVPFLRRLKSKACIKTLIPTHSYLQNHTVA